MVDAESGEVHTITVDHNGIEEEHEMVVEGEDGEHELVEDEDVICGDVEEQIQAGTGNEEEVLTIHDEEDQVITKYERESDEEQDEGMANCSTIEMCYITTTSSQ
jgi:hypothetical protein